MKTKMKKSGITLMEMVAVVAAVALLTMLSLPSIRSLRKSFVSEAAARSLINSTLASARAMAAKKRCHVGVRFQTAYEYNDDVTALNDPDELYAHDVLNAEQYMIFIMNGTDRSKVGNDKDTFIAVEGIKPIKLPNNFGVMDMNLRGNNPANAADKLIDSNGDIDELKELHDTTSFSIIFSPSGKLVICGVRCLQKDQNTNPENEDTTFNLEENVKAIQDTNGKYVKNRAMFFQDDYDEIGLGEKFSKRRFMIYEKDKFNPFFENGSAYEDYLEDLWDTKQIYVNPYTGQLICP